MDGVKCLCITVLLLAGCSSNPEKLDMTNPASTYCIEQGGKLKMQKDQDGNASGYCHFEDGTVCEEWAFFRGQCRPGQ